MSLALRHLALATAATLAVGAGVGAAPALASPDLLALSIRNVQPVTDLSISSAPRNAAQERADARTVDENATSCAEAVKLIAPLHASTDQVKAKREWLTGLRLAIIGDHHDAAGLLDDAAGHRAAGTSEVAASDPDFSHAKRDIAEADPVFGAH